MRDPDHPQRLWQGPWIQAQTWNDLLFAHWPIAPETMRRALPPSIELDTFDNQAWLGLVPFGITGFRARFFPPFPGLGAFLEINVRTYVTVGGKPGVYFFSLDAANRLAVLGARSAYHLPYFHARMNLHHENKGIVYESKRIDRNESPAVFKGRYYPIGAVRVYESDTLDYWLTERYCLYAVDKSGNVYRAGIQHPRWRLQPAALAIDENTLLQADGVALPNVPPLLHFSRRQDVIVWPPMRVKTSL